MKKLTQLIKEIGFRDRMSKSVDDESKAEFQEFGEYVGSLYQKFQTKDLSSEPAIAQKIRDFVSIEDAESELVNKIKDLEHLINQLPDKIGKRDKIGFRRDESYHAIRGPIDVISQNLSMSTSSEIKQIGQDVFGIVPQDFGEDAEAIGDEIDNILVNSTDDEMKDYFYKYFGAYADEIAQEHGFYQDEVNEDYYEKASDLDRKDIEHKLDTLLDKVKPSPKNMEARQGLKAALKSNNVVMMKKALDHWSNKLGLDEMTNDEFAKAKEADRLEKHPERDKIKKVQDLVRQQKEALQIRAGIIK